MLPAVSREWPGVLSRRSRRLALTIRSTAALSLALGLALAPALPAHASPITVYDQLSDGAWRTAAGSTSVAQSFTTGSDLLRTTSIEIVYRNANESNTWATTSTYSLEVWSADPGPVPGEKVATLEKDASIGPWANGQLTLNTGVTLQPSTTYFLVMTGGAGGTMSWKYTGTTPTTDITPAPTYVALRSADAGATWSPLASTYFSMRITAGIATLPSAPTITSLAPGLGQLVVTSTLGTGGSGTTMDMEYELDGSGTWVSTGQVSPTFTIAGLTGGTTYSVRVREVTTVGPSPASAAMTGMPVGPPGAPTITALTPGDGTLDVTATLGSSGGLTVTGVEYELDGSGTWVSSGQATGRFTITGLTNGTTYSVRVRAVSPVGSSPASAAVSGTPAASATAPIIRDLIGGDGSLRVIASLGTGSATDVEYRLASGVWTSTGQATGRFTITGLANGTDYTVRIRAITTAGAGPTSAPATGTPLTTPGAPRAVRAVADGEQITVTWQPPADDGGREVRRYSVTGDPEGSCQTSGTSCALTGLTAGVDYTFTVVATTSVGSGPASRPSRPVTPEPTPTPTPEPTPTPTPEPTPTPTPEPTPTPTPEPTPPPTPEPTPTPTPSPTPTPTPAPTPTPTPTPDPAPTPTPFNPFDVFREGAGGPSLGLALAVGTGQTAAGSGVEVTAAGFTPGTLVEVLVYSDPVSLGFTTVGPDGTARLSTTLPPGLPPGTHTIVAQGTGPDGTAVQSMAGLRLDDAGVVTAVTPAGQVSGVAPDGPEIQRALRFGAAPYVAANHPVSTAGLTSTAMVFLGLAGAAGIAGTMLARTASTTSPGPGTPGPGDPGPVRSADRVDRGAATRSSTRWLLMGIVTKKLKAQSSEGTARGDASATWRLPGTSSTDALGPRLAAATGRMSVLLPRVAVDGSWARAMFGSASLLLWVCGAVLGLLNVIGTSGRPAPASVAIILAIVALSILDAAAGFIAWLVITVGTVVTGNLQGLADLRTLMGMGLLLFTISLLAHVIRPLRRRPATTALERFDRVADYIMPPVFLGLAGAAMYKSLNGLSGLQLVDSANTTTLRILIAAAFIVRLVMEDVATHLYPERFTAVQPGRFTPPAKHLQVGSAIVRFIVIIIVALPFLGLSWTAVLVALLITIPNVLKIWEDDLPNSAWLNRWYPRGVARFLILLLLGVLISAAILGPSPTPDTIRDHAAWLLVPAALSGVIELVGREGYTWRYRWGIRGVGALVWLAAIIVVLMGISAPR